MGNVFDPVLKDAKANVKTGPNVFNYVFQVMCNAAPRDLQLSAALIVSPSSYFVHAICTHHARTTAQLLPCFSPAVPSPLFLSCAELGRRLGSGCRSRPRLPQFVRRRRILQRARGVSVEGRHADARRRGASKGDGDTLQVMLVAASAVCCFRPAMTFVAAGAMPHLHLQHFHIKLWLCTIGQCVTCSSAPRQAGCTASNAALYRFVMGATTEAEFWTRVQFERRIGAATRTPCARIVHHVMLLWKK